MIQINREGVKKMAKKEMDTQKVQECLRGINYPSSKEELIQHAQNTCGDEAVVSMLKDLPEQTYGSVNDLTGVLRGVLGNTIRLDVNL